MDVTNILRLSGPVLQTCLIAVFIKRSTHRAFRYFFTYTVFAVMTEMAKFLLHGRVFLYFYLYWSSEVIYAILGFAALYEAFRHLFRHLYYLRGIRLAFPITAMLVLTLSALWILIHGQPVHAIPLLRVIFALEFAVRLLQIGFFVLVIGVALYHRSYIRRRGFGVAAGFGISASGIFAATVVRSEFGTSYPNLLAFLPPVAYLIAVVVWLLEFARPEPIEPMADYRQHDPWEMLARVRQLRKEAGEFLGRLFVRHRTKAGRSPENSVPFA